MRTTIVPESFVRLLTAFEDCFSAPAIGTLSPWSLAGCIAWVGER